MKYERTFKTLATLAAASVCAVLTPDPPGDLSASERILCYQLVDRQLREARVDIMSIQPYTNFGRCQYYMLKHG